MSPALAAALAALRGGQGLPVERHAWEVLETWEEAEAERLGVPLAPGFDARTDRMDAAGRVREKMNRRMVGVTFPCARCGAPYVRQMVHQRRCGVCIGRRKARLRGVLPLVLLAAALVGSGCGAPDAPQPPPPPPADTTRSWCHSGACAEAVPPGDPVTPPPPCPSGATRDYCQSPY